jgi:hypothetical protein
VRDNFHRKTIDAVAKRAGYLCSNPACRTSTSGPHDDESRAVLIGVAAHITAASAGGPRFDCSLTESQRKSPRNAIWLCGNCSKLIDSDPDAYPVHVLLSWKEAAEALAARKIAHLPVLNVSAKLNSAPPLPPYYVPRTETLRELEDIQSGSGALSGSVHAWALYGMGGIGKSTVASAFCHSAHVKQRFPDGVLWATLGLNPNVLSILSDWLLLLGDTESNPTTIGTASARFRGLVSERRILVPLARSCNA